MQIPLILYEMSSKFIYTLDDFFFCWIYIPCLSSFVSLSPSQSFSLSSSLYIFLSLCLFPLSVFLSIIICFRLSISFPLSVFASPPSLSVFVSSSSLSSSSLSLYCPLYHYCPSFTTSLSPFLTIPLFTVILSGLFLPLISLHLSNSVILYSSPSLTSNLVKSWMVALGEFTLSVIPLQPAIPPPFLPTSYDKFLQYGMECQQAFMTFREKIPQSVRQILMLIEFLIVYSAAISWVVHLPLAVGRVGLKYTRYVLADS